MEVQNLRFACERHAGGRWRVYDSIECLLRDRAASAGAIPAAEAAAQTWLADYDTEQIHRADSLWIVSGSFTTPMGGGLAAFLSRESAEEVALNAHGRMHRFDQTPQGAGGSEP
jgi:nitrous oxide reductase accessory protein NosL